ncbi:hypothetical protein AYJ58_01150 [Shewanella sp. Pdp11]|uniref:TIR domain-containing protein n=1 Tax=Shewanella sp. Pdp11 TaxID=2059264 RepID=UPI000CA3BEF4|nr:nucleotide-binding protein [Shewanella sp. Pdp11]AUD58180.1 hypothetical protein AYJ58_01150 [Shewanella sp. Pdp11]
MANLSRRDISSLEKYLQMEGGHLLDFSHKTLADFFDDYGIDINEEQYQFGSGSKANRMRGFWHFSDEATVGTVLLGIIDYYDEKRENSYYGSQNHSDDLRARCLDIANRLVAGSYRAQSHLSAPHPQPSSTHASNPTKPFSPPPVQQPHQPFVPSASVQQPPSSQTLLQPSILYQQPQQVLQPTQQLSDTQKVFIVHGHDDVLRLEVENFVRTVGLKPVVLMNQASGGNTIIEKIEEHGAVDYAIVLYTPCDEGRKKGTEELNGRARQNVVFEHGYFIARLGRKKVSAIVKTGVEIQNDIQGVVYISAELDWQTQLLKEFKKARITFDADALFV